MCVCTLICFHLRELLEFYRQKFSEYDVEYQQLFHKLEGFEYIQKELVTLLYSTIDYYIIK